MNKSIPVIITLLFIILSCSKGGSSTDGGSNNGGGGGSTVNCSGVPASFANDVTPIVQTKCATDASCHGSGSANGPGPLLNYTQISNAKGSIKIAVANGSMPKTGTLTTAQKNSIICWVDSGGPNN